jgi:hypothetical protein
LVAAKLVVFLPKKQDKYLIYLHNVNFTHYINNLFTTIYYIFTFILNTLSIFGIQVKYDVLWKLPEGLRRNIRIRNFNWIYRKLVAQTL